MSSQENIKPRIAILMATYNGLNWLPEQIDSIFNQVDVDVTLYVSDDSSTDGSYDWLKRAVRNNNRIVLLPNKARMGSAGKNFYRLLRDVDFSNFSYVAFADQDDIWSVNKLSRACEQIKKFGVDGYSSDVTAFWPNGRKLYIKKSQTQVRYDYMFEAAGPGCTYMLSQNLISDIKSTALSNPDLDTIILHDWFFYAFARAKGYSWIIDEFSGLLYRQHAQNQVGVNIGSRAFFNRSAKILSGWGLSQAEKIARFIGIENDPFVRRWLAGGRLGILYLATQAFSCRRRLRDKFLFACSCAIFFFKGKFY